MIELIGRLCRLWVSLNQKRPGAWGRLAFAVAVYLCVTGVYFALAPRALLVEHTQYNHFAHLAHSWINGHLDMLEGPPHYAQNNDFALYNDKWYVAFPPFPAVVLLPVVAFAKDPERVRDGQIFLWIAGAAPALLFLALERLRIVARYSRGLLENIALSLLFAFGTVYFFTALQGTVWFAAHVVGAALAAGYLFCSLGAINPLWAGVCLGLASLTRPPLMFAFPLFLFQAWQFSRLEQGGALARVSFWRQLFAVNWRKLIIKCALFALPVVLCIAFSLWHNKARFGSPWESGYQYLQVAWKARMAKWGLFHYHYLSKNLGVLLTSLPWFELGMRRFQINVHGLALWFTTPVYLWLFWPRRKATPHWGLWLTVAAVALPTLFYQNTGWSQFGYRFSNDYAVFLFALLAIGARRFSTAWILCALFGVAINSFGAATFGRPDYSRFYHHDGTQERVYQAD